MSKQTEHVAKYRKANLEKAAAYQREYRKLNRESMRASEKKTYEKSAETRCDHQREYRKSNLPTVMCGSAKKASKLKGLPFDLTSEYLKSIWPVDDTCPILGIKFTTALKGCSRDASASLDRIIPSLGYTQGNVHVISFRANRIKNDSTIEELETLVNYLRQLSSSAHKNNC